MSDKHIVVAGDISEDILVYLFPLNPDPGSNQRGKQKLRVHRCGAGAIVLADLLLASAEQHKHQIHAPSFRPENDGLEYSASSIMELELVDPDVPPPSSFKVRRRQRLDVETRWHSPQLLPTNSDNLTVLIFQDAEGGFNDSYAAIELYRKSRPHILLHHMARPLGAGQIWDAIRHGPYVKDGSQNPERLIVVVSADDLRAEGIELSHGLSWEKTCEDFVEKLGSLGRLSMLVTCAHLIVLFGCDGVIYHRGREMVQPILFFDPLCAEGEFIRRNLGYFPGLPEAFVCGLATELAQSPEASLDKGIKSGFSAARRLAKLGFRNGVIHDWPRYPVVDVMQNRLQSEHLATLSIPSETIARGANWSILHQNIGDPVEVARQIVKTGIRSAITHMPLAQFGGLVLVDRLEIEAFRTFFNSIQEYLSTSHTKPLSIAILGSRSSGKSFAATQVAIAAASGRKIRHLRFDLSRFTSLNDLSIAFHTIRDCTLSGLLPIVYIHAWDTELSGSPLGWVPYLLDPMHGGQFLDHGEMRPIGPAILLFGSNTVKSFEEYTAIARPVTASVEEFLSCLQGIVNVLGPDRVDESDTLYPVRRAVVLRALLEEREPSLRLGEGISIDESVLDGLLMVPTYRHGIRSLKSIIDMSRLTNRRHFERAALPPESQLGLHLDYPNFLQYLQGSTLPDDIREAIAERLHMTYVEYRMKMAQTPAELDESRQDSSMCAWASLREEFRESVRAHASDLPRKLRMISCFLAPQEDNRVPVDRFTAKELEFMAEIEHERWNGERLHMQWEVGERNTANRKRPLLVPWRDLERKWQLFDIEMVKSYTAILPQGYKIYRKGVAGGIVREPMKPQSTANLVNSSTL